MYLYIASSANLCTFISSSVPKPSEIYFIVTITPAKSELKFITPFTSSITNVPFFCVNSGIKPNFNKSSGSNFFSISPVCKLITESEKEFLISQGNGVFLFQAGQEMEIAPFLDHIRRYIFKPTTEQQFTFCWIDNFPYFEVENGNLQPSHHPFTAPTNEEDFIDNPELSTALHYDLVLNGVELGSGSQRISNPDLQRIVLEKWGLSNEEIQDRFGWFIEALSYGTPQHAGFAIGIDRLIAEVYNQNSIRDVIPFPKTQSGLDPLTDAPSYINENILEEYNLKYINKDE